MNDFIGKHVHENGWTSSVITGPHVMGSDDAPFEVWAWHEDGTADPAEPIGYQTAAEAEAFVKEVAAR